MGTGNGASIPALEDSPIHLLHRAGQCAGDLFADEVAGEGLTPRQYAVLLSVSRNEGLSQSDLVVRTGIDRSTLADIIGRLLKKGLLTRRRTREDARAYSVRLTESGRAALAAAQPAALSADQHLLDALPPEMREAFVECLNTIIRELDGPARKS